jgi:hypothetical protein
MFWAACCWVGGGKGLQKNKQIYICADHVEWYTLCVLFQYRVVIEVQCFEQKQTSHILKSTLCSTVYIMINKCM